MTSLTKQEISDYNSQWEDEPCRKEALFAQDLLNGIVNDEFYDSTPLPPNKEKEPSVEFLNHLQQTRDILIKYGFMKERK